MLLRGRLPRPNPVFPVPVATGVLKVAGYAVYRHVRFPGCRFLRNREPGCIVPRCPIGEKFFKDEKTVYMSDSNVINSR